MRRIRLAVVVALILSAAPCTGEAQQSVKLIRLGRLSLSVNDVGRAPTDAILDGLRELGYVEHRDFIFERRDAGGNADRLPALALELVRLPVDVLLVGGVTATAAARKATGTIPIVCVMGDPVGEGFVKSLAHPGGNITGVTLTSGGTDIGGKFLQLLREVIPNVTRIGFLRSANNPATVPTAFFPAEILSQVRLVTVQIREPGELERRRSSDRCAIQADCGVRDDAPPSCDLPAKAIRGRWWSDELRAKSL
jgi:putative ABC transport system substrate-binding protein